MTDQLKPARIALGLTLGISLAAAGCHQDSPPPYGAGITSPAQPMEAMPPARPVVPAGAELLSQGTYNQIQFQVPSRPGLIYVFDHDTNTVVGTTNSVATDAGRSMTMADLKNTAQGLSMTDRYQIYFAPSTPTTMPVGGGMSR